MSKVAITGNASGTGTFTLAAPNSNSDRTLTLPDNTGTMMLTNTAVAKSQLPAGSVLQVVSFTYATEVASSSTSFADTGLTASITPTSASSKILVVVTQNGCGKTAQNSLNGVQLKLLRGATDLAFISKYLGYTETALRNFQFSAAISYLDSPNTTSSTTYKTQFANSTAADAVLVQQGSAVSAITLMEIAG